MINKKIEVQLKKYIEQNYDDPEKEFEIQIQGPYHMTEFPKSCHVVQEYNTNINNSRSNTFPRYSYYDNDKCCCEEPIVIEQEMAPKFAEQLFKFIDEKNMADVECYKKAGVDRRLFSKIKSDKDYQPSKKTILAFVIALNLNVSEANTLLSSGGYTLSHSYLRDVIIEYCLENKIYDIYDVNTLLAKHNEELIIFE